MAERAEHWEALHKCSDLPQHVLRNTWVAVSVMAAFVSWVLLNMREPKSCTSMHAWDRHPQAEVVTLQSRLETAEMQLADVTAALERLQSEHKRLQVGTCLPACAAALCMAGSVRGRGLLQS